MVDFAKKIKKARAEDLLPGEEIVAAVFAQPAGAISKQVGFGVGGVVGGIVGDKMAKKRAEGLEGASEAGIATQLPAGKPLHLAVTSHRFLAFGHGTMSGKPKELEAHLRRQNDARGIQTQSQAFVDALEARKKPVKQLLFPDEGRFIQKWENRLRFHRTLENFLARHLGGRRSPYDQIELWIELKR